jgi:hypothetical protein
MAVGVIRCRAAATCNGLFDPHLSGHLPTADSHSAHKRSRFDHMAERFSQASSTRGCRSARSDQPRPAVSARKFRQRPCLRASDGGRGWGTSLGRRPRSPSKRRSCANSVSPTKAKVLRMRAISQAVFRIVLGLLFYSSVSAVTTVHKCVVDGAVTYQSVPCPSGQAGSAPTAQQLNAERRKRAAAAAAGEVASNQQTLTAPAQSTVSSKSEPAAPVDLTTPRPNVTQALSKPKGNFECDARKYCSQMTSCAEAKYFLADCAGVKMDGDANGVPCEQQWCSR